MTLNQQVTSAALGGGRILLATDFDGTLCSIVAHPHKAALSSEANEVLEALQRSDGVTVAIISGRSVADLRSKIALPVVLSGNHGLEISGAGIHVCHPRAAAVRAEMVELYHRLVATTSAWPGSWVEDKGASLTVHYREVQKDRLRLLVAVNEVLNPFREGIRWRSGKEAVEVLPRVGWNKGSAMRYIRRRLGPHAVTVCFGDDATDESMFRANRGQVCVKVGWGEPTHANYVLNDHSEVVQCLKDLADALKSSSTM